MDRDGLLSKEQEATLVEALAGWIQFKNKILNMVKPTALTIGIRAIDNQGLDRLSPDWKADLIPIIDKAMAGNVEETRRLVTDLVNKRVDIPKVDEETELIIYDSLTKLLAGLLLNLAYKKRYEEEL